MCRYSLGAVFSYKLRYIVGFWLVEMVISTNPKPTIYRNLYENTAPGDHPRLAGDHPRLAGSGGASRQRQSGVRANKHLTGQDTHNTTLQSKRRYLHTLQVSRYCLLRLQRRSELHHVGWLRVKFLLEKISACFKFKIMYYFFSQRFSVFVLFWVDSKLNAHSWSHFTSANEIHTHAIT